MTAASFVCPFCPLHCDDLDAVGLTPKGARRAELSGLVCSLLTQRRGPAIAHDATSPAAGASALQTARDWIAEATSVLVTGRVIDLQTARAVTRFAERTGAVAAFGEPGLSRDQSPAQAAAAADAAAYRAAVARQGVFATTLGDAASPHSSVIMIGDPSPSWPRLRERLAAAGEILTWQRTHLLAERLARLRRVMCRPAEGLPVDDVDLAKSAALCGRAARVVFVVAPGSVGAAQAVPFWSTMLGLLRELNQRQRAALLRFDDGLTLRSVQAWSGDAQAQSVVGDPRSGCDLVIELSPWPLEADGQAESSAAAASHGGVGRPEVTGQSLDRRRRITIGWARPAVEGSAADSGECHLPATVAGIGRSAVVLRGDGSVALPLRMLVTSALPSPAKVLDQLIL